MKGKRGPRPELLGELSAGRARGAEAALLVAKARLLRRKDGKKEAVLALVLPLPGGAETEGMPAEARAAHRFFAAEASCEELAIDTESGPWNMRCRPLPARAGAVTSEQFLRALLWRRLRLVRGEAGIELRFQVTLDLDAATGPWVLENFGNEIFCELEAAQMDLGTEGGRS